MTGGFFVPARASLAGPAGAHKKPPGLPGVKVRERLCVFLEETRCTSWRGSLPGWRMSRKAHVAVQYKESWCAAQVHCTKTLSSLRLRPICGPKTTAKSRARRGPLGANAKAMPWPPPAAPRKRLRLPRFADEGAWLYGGSGGQCGAAARHRGKASRWRGRAVECPCGRGGSSGRPGAARA